MRNFVIIAALFIGASADVKSQTQAGKNNQSSSVEQTLIHIEQELRNASLKGDSTTFLSFVASDYVFTDPFGGFHTMATIKKDPSPKFESIDIDDIKVQSYGNTAVVTYRFTIKGTVGSMDISGKHRWTDVFMKQGTQWKIIA